MAINLGLRWYGERLETADFTTTNKSQSTTFDQNYVLTSSVVRLIYTDDPTFTDMTLKVYTDRAGSPGALLATSTTTYTKAQIVTDNTGFVQAPFVWDNLHVRNGLNYHFVVNGTGYTATDSSNIMWIRDVDPIYKTGLTVTFETLGLNPLSLAHLGYEL